MRRIVLAILFMLTLLALGPSAQALCISGTSTCVSVTVVDSGGQAWANGTVTFTYNGPVNATWAGGNLPLTFSTSLGSSGSAGAIAIPDNNQIVPSPSFWNIRACPQLGIAAQCFVQSAVTITGASQNVTLTPPAIAISGNSPLPVAAYADSEIVAPVITGFIYDQLTAVGVGSYRECDAVNASGKCTTWNPVGSGSGGAPVTGSGTTGFIPVFTGSTTIGNSPCDVSVTTAGNITCQQNLAVGEVISTAATGLDLALLCDASGGLCHMNIGENDANERIALNGGTIVDTGLTSISRIAPAITDSVGTASPVTPGSVTQRSVTTSPDPIVSTDRGNRVVYNSASAVAVTLPQANTGGFSGGFNTRISNQNAGVVTVTPTTSTINGNPTLALQEGQDCLFTPSSAGTDWAADCNEPQTTAGGGIALTRGVHSLTVGAVGCQVGCYYALGLGDGATISAAAGSALTTANHPAFFRFYNDKARAITTGCFEITTLSAGGNASVSVFSVSGTALTRIWNTGAKSTAAVGAQCGTATVANLLGGQNYYICFDADNTTAAVGQLVGNAGGIPVIMGGANAPNTYGLNDTDVGTGGVCPATATTTNITNNNAKLLATGLQVFN